MNLSSVHRTKEFNIGVHDSPQLKAVLLQFITEYSDDAMKPPVDNPEAVNILVSREQAQVLIQDLLEAIQEID